MSTKPDKVVKSPSKPKISKKTTVFCFIYWSKIFIFKYKPSISLSKRALDYNSEKRKFQSNTAWLVLYVWQKMYHNNLSPLKEPNLGWLGYKFTETCLPIVRFYRSRNLQISVLDKLANSNFGLHLADVLHFWHVT